MPLRRLIRGKLSLTEEQETRLMTAVKDSFDDLFKTTGHQGNNRFIGWADMRRQDWAEYNGDFQHRANSPDYGPLFANFDNSLNVPQRAIRVAKARISESLYNTEPWAALLPQGEANRDPGVIAAERWFQYALKQADSRNVFRAATEAACVCGEGIIKITKKKVLKENSRAGAVWVDAAGIPIRDSKARVVVGNDPEGKDVWMQDATVLERQVLKYDPETMRPDGAVLDPSKQEVLDVPEERMELVFKNVEWTDFFCSTTAESIHTTRAIHETFDMDWDDLADSIPDGKLSPEAKQFLQQLKNNTPDPKTESDIPNTKDGEEEPGKDSVPRLGLVETYIRIDATDSGQAKELFVLWVSEKSLEGAYPVYYDLLSEVSATGGRPYEIDRVIPKKDRWWGVSFYRLLKKLHEFIDKQWAKIEARNSTAGRFTWIRDGAFKEQAFGIPLELNAPRVWHLKEEIADARQAFGFVELPKMEDGLWKMLEQANQMAQLLSGTLMPSEADMADSKLVDTATGINSLTAESELLSGDTLQDIIASTERILKQAVIVLFSEWESNKSVAVDILGQAQWEQLNEWLAKNESEGLLKHVRLLLTKARNKEQFAANEQAHKLVAGGMSWLELCATYPQFAEQFRPLYKSMLDSLDVDQSESILKMPTQPAPGAPPAPGGDATPTLPNAPSSPASSSNGNGVQPPAVSGGLAASRSRPGLPTPSGGR